MEKVNLNDHYNLKPDNAVKLSYPDYFDEKTEK